MAESIQRRYPNFPVAGRSGTSLKPEHLAQILRETPDGGFFEVHAENYMGAGGAPHVALDRIRRDRPLSIHGVCMSIGGPEPLDREHLARFAALVARYEPALVSEHLAWSTHDTVFLNDLLPLPYNKQTLRHVVSHIIQVQDAIGRPLLMENPSSYLVFEQSTMSEADFIREMVEQSGCGLLLDLGNVIVSSTNLGTTPMSYLSRYPLEHVREIHLAGHAEDEDDTGRLILIDSHDRAVPDPVWHLFDRVIGQCGPLPTLVEWDNDIPDWTILKAEARAAQEILDRHADSYMMGRRHA